MATAISWLDSCRQGRGETVGRPSHRASMGEVGTLDMVFVSCPYPLRIEGDKGVVVTATSKKWEDIPHFTRQSFCRKSPIRGVTATGFL